MSSPLSPSSSASSSSITSSDSGSKNQRKRAYEKPDFITSQAFERQSLSCAGCLNQSASFPVFCGMRS
jgi:hypothetical protein